MRKTCDISHALLKLTFAVLTSYLLYEEFYIFLIRKPTHSSSAKIKTSFEEFPDVTICPFPSYNQPKLIALGYGQSYEFAMGVLRNSNLKGWLGNISGIKIDFYQNLKVMALIIQGSSPEDVIKKVSMIRNVEECPETKVKMLDQNREIFVKINFNLTAMFHPKGKCCKVQAPLFGIFYHETLFRQLFLRRPPI